MFRRAQELGVTIPQLSDSSTGNPFQHHNQGWDTDLVPEERQVMVRILQLPDVIRRIELTLEPNVGCAYLFQLVKEFSSFYENCKILHGTLVGKDGGEKFNATQTETEQEKQRNIQRQTRRLMLCLATEHTLSRGLELLNIQPVDRI